MINLDGLTDSQRIVLLQSKEIEQDSKISQHHGILVEGNGALPLVERVRNLEAFTGALKFWLRTVAVAIVIQTVTFGIASIVYFVRLFPLLQKLANQP